MREVDGDRERPRASGIERVARQRGHDEQNGRGGPHERPDDGVPRPERGRRCADEGRRRADLERQRVPGSAGAGCVEQRAAAARRHREGDDDEASRREVAARLEQRAACDERAEQEQRPQEHVFPAQLVMRREHRPGRPAARADREGEDALLAVPVVGDDAPADAVVAVPEIRPQRQRESLALGKGRAGEDRAGAVPHSFVSRTDADDVVEDDEDLTRRLRQRRAVGRHRSHEVRVRRRGCRKGKRRKRGDDNDEPLRQVICNAPHDLLWFPAGSLAVTQKRSLPGGTRPGTFHRSA